MMKGTALSAVVLLTCHNAGAFVGHSVGAFLNLKLSTSRQQQQHQHQQHQQRRRGQHDKLLSFPCRGHGLCGVARRRQLSGAPCAVSMSAADGEGAAEADKSSGDSNEEDMDTTSMSSKPAADEAHEEVESSTAATAAAAATAAEGAPAAAAAVASTEGGVAGVNKEGEEGAEEEKEGGKSDRKDGAAEAEEGEGEGETVYLPTGDNKDFRLFRAKLRAGSDEKWQEQLKRNVNVGQLAGQDAWAHELSAPEKGCLIVAKSTEFSMAQAYFNEAVIFLASHDEVGSAGFILNRPTSVQLGDLVEGNALPQFRKSPLYLGGDVGEGNVQILHPFGPDRLSDSMEVIPGVYIGGAVDEADRMVATGRAKVDDFKFMLHLCGWAPGQLEAEIARGVWLPVATSANVVLKHCLGLPVPMWREVMTLMGPKYGLLARDTYDDL